jgi:hypothetical protein
VTAILWGDDMDAFNPDGSSTQTRTTTNIHEVHPTLNVLHSELVLFYYIVLAFSGSPIDQGFVITDSVCIIPSIVRQYEVLPPTDACAWRNS